MFNIYINLRRQDGLKLKNRVYCFQVNVFFLIVKGIKKICTLLLK